MYEIEIYFRVVDRGEARRWESETEISTENIFHNTQHMKRRAQHTNIFQSQHSHRSVESQSRSISCAERSCFESSEVLWEFCVECKYFLSFFYFSLRESTILNINCDWIQVDLIVSRFWRIVWKSSNSQEPERILIIYVPSNKTRSGWETKIIRIQIIRNSIRKFFVISDNSTLKITSVWTESEFYHSSERRICMFPSVETKIISEYKVHRLVVRWWNSLNIRTTTKYKCHWWHKLSDSNATFYHRSIALNNFECL